MRRFQKMRGMWLPVILAVVLSTVVSTQAVAGTMFWSGSDTWNATDTNWGASYGTYSGSAWVDGSTAFFGGAGTVTIADGFTPEVAGIVFNANCPISGSSLTLTSNSILGSTPGTINSAIAGTVGLKWSGNDTLTLAGDNTYSGVTNVYSNQITLASTGSLLMDINSSGAYSYLTSTASSLRALKLDGTLKLDVADVTGNSGSWLLVDVDELNETYGDTFAMELADGTSFFEVGNVWTCVGGGGNWTFTESTGVLGYVAVPEPGTLTLLAAGLIGLLVCVWRKRR